MNSNRQTYSDTFKSCLHKNLDQSRFFLSNELFVLRSVVAIFFHLILNAILFLQTILFIYLFQWYIFFLHVKLLNFLVYLFFSLKFFNTQNLVKTVAFGIKTQCKVFLIQTCRFGFPEIRLSLASKLAFTHCLKFSSFKDVSSDFEFFFP